MPSIFSAGLWIPVPGQGADPHWLFRSWPLPLRLVLESREGLSGQGLWWPEFCALAQGYGPASLLRRAVQPQIRLVRLILGAR